MKRFLVRLSLRMTPVLALACILIAAAAPQAGVRSTAGLAIALPPGGDGMLATANSVSQYGTVGATETAPGVFQAVLWEKEDEATPVVTLLDTPAGQSSFAYSISNKGIIVGVTQSAGRSQAVVWQKNGDDYTVTNLPNPLGGASDARGINNNASELQIVGAAQTNLGEWHAALWKAMVTQQAAAFSFTDLGAMGATSHAYAISDFGWIAGSSSTATGNTHAVVWRYVNGHSRYELTDLMPGIKRESEARSLNINGLVGGSVQIAGGLWRAYRWTVSNTVSAKELGTLGTGRNSHGYGIDLQGNVVGASETDVNSSTTAAVILPVTGAVSTIPPSTGLQLVRANGVGGRYVTGNCRVSVNGVSQSRGFWEDLGANRRMHHPLQGIRSMSLVATTIGGSPPTQGTVTTSDPSMTVYLQSSDSGVDSVPASVMTGTVAGADGTYSQTFPVTSGNAGTVNITAYETTYGTTWSVSQTVN